MLLLALIFFYQDFHNVLCFSPLLLHFGIHFFNFFFFSILLLFECLPIVACHIAVSPLSLSLFYYEKERKKKWFYLVPSRHNKKYLNFGADEYFFRFFIFYFHLEKMWFIDCKTSCSCFIICVSECCYLLLTL